jgi:hypothetical protein
MALDASSPTRGSRTTGTALVAEAEVRGTVNGIAVGADWSRSLFCGCRATDCSEVRLTPVAAAFADCMGAAGDEVETETPASLN